MRRIGLAPCLVAAACASWAPGVDVVEELEPERWLEVRTGDFTLFTNAAPEEARRAAERLARFTDALHELSGRAPTGAPRSVQILAFRTLRQYGAFPVPAPALGYMIPTLEGSVMALPLELPAVTVPVLQHEFAHEAVHAAGGALYPLWYDEGFAELMSSVVIREDVVTIGLVPELRRRELARHAPRELGRLLAARTRAELSGPWYVDAWLTVHYLHARRPRLARELDVYLGRLTAGEDRIAAFERSFGIPVAELDAALAEHRERVLRGAPVAWEARVAERERALETRALAPRAAAVLLGRHALRTGQTDSARALFLHAASLEPADVDAALGLAGVEAERGDWQAAARAIARARALGAEAEADEASGQLALERASAAPESSAEQAALAASARADFLRAVTRAPEAVAAWAGLGATYLLDGADPTAGIEALERARRGDRWNPTLNLMLGELLLKRGDRDRARERLLVAAAAAHDDAAAQRAQALLDSLGQAAD